MIQSPKLVWLTQLNYLKKQTYVEIKPQTYVLWKKYQWREKREMWVCTFSRGASCSLRSSNLSISSLSLLSWCCSMHSVVYSCWTRVFTSFSVAAFSWLRRSERKRLLLFFLMYALSKELLFLGLLDNKIKADSSTIGICFQWETERK